MNTVIYVNYRKYCAQNKPALDFFIRMFKDGGVVDDEFKRIRRRHIIRIPVDFTNILLGYRIPFYIYLLAIFIVAVYQPQL